MHIKRPAGYGRLIRAFVMAAGCILMASCNGDHRPPDKVENNPVPDSSLTWTDYKTNGPAPPHTYKTFDRIIQKWGIRYKRIEDGSDTAKSEMAAYTSANLKYFRYLEQKWGKDWRIRFDQEVAAQEKELSNVSASPGEITCTDDIKTEDTDFGQTCIYHNYSIQQAWTSFLQKNKNTEDGMFLLPVIPVRDTVISVDTMINSSRYILEVSYELKKTSATATLEFPGGVTTLIFKTSGPDTRVHTNHSPD